MIMIMIMGGKLAPGAPNSAKFRGGCRFDKEGGVTNIF